MCLATFFGNLFVAACERNRLEGEQSYLLRVVERELNDAAYLFIVDTVDDGNDWHDADASVVEMLNRLQLHVEEIADAAMRVSAVPDPVELQVGVTQSRLSSRFRKLWPLGELDAVGCDLHDLVADLSCVAHCVYEVWRERRLAAGELHRQLSARPERDCVVEQLLDVRPGQLMDEADLIRIHEARIAHHVAAIGEINCQHRAATVLNGTAPVIV